MQKVDHIIEQKEEQFLGELLDFLRIPSISTDSAYQQEVSRAAEWLAEKLRELGLDEVKIFPTDGHPIVFAQKHVYIDLPTVLVYGHYDVQPPDPMNLWHTPPFEPEIRDGKIFARGACDDKGQVYMHVKAVELLLQQGSLPCNVKFLIEGEEEVGSQSLEPFLVEHRDLLSTDLVLISDTSMLSNDTPSITTGIRGMAYMEVTVKGPNRDLHSGVYGGSVDNPINVLCEMIASLKDEEGKITVEGFYDDVIELSREERDKLAEAPFDKTEFLKDLGVKDAQGEAGYSVKERSSIRPSLDVNGIWGGYTAEGSKTVLPSEAHAKISMRLVPNQNAEDIATKFTTYFQKLAPMSVQVEIRTHHGGEPAVTSTHSIGYQAASKAMELAFGKVPIPTREGGSIPIVARFQQILKADPILMGFGLNSDNIHSPNEHYGVFNYKKGIEAITYFHQYYAELAKS